MTKEQFAALLNGREYGSEITKEEEALAKKTGLLVIFGYSDDNMELRGAVDDEVGCYNGGAFLIDAEGVLLDWDDIDHDDIEECASFFQRKPKTKMIKAVWSKEGYSWIYETDVPHATFDIMEEGEKYCRGIVIDVKDL